MEDLTVTFVDSPVLSDEAASRILAMGTEDDADDMISELIDRYGDPPGSAVRAVLSLDKPAELEVRGICGRDKTMAGVTTDREGSRVELRLRPTWLTRLLTLQFHVRGKAQIKEIRLYSAP